MFARERELGGSVVEGRSRPSAGCMAQLAFCRECRCHMVRSCRAPVIGEMAGDARRGERRVLIIYMTGGACHVHVFSGERKLGRAVVETCALPLCSRMALLAVSRECCGHVIRRFRVLIIRQMAGGAVRRQARILPAGVTLCASYGRVFAG